MNILHLTHSFLPTTENWVYSQFIHNKQCRPSVLCQYRENEADFPLDSIFARYPKKTFFNDLQLKLALKRGRYSVKHTRQVIDTIKPDLIHGHFGFVSCCHLEALRQSALPLVTTFYGLDIGKLPQKAMWRKRYAKLFSHGAAFIVEGLHMAGCLARLGCPRDKIHCIPIGVDTETLRRGSGVKRTGPAMRVLFTGLGREKKGAVYAASAFITVAKKHPDIHFDLIGGGKFVVPTRNMLVQAGIIDKCTFHGQVPVAKYREILLASDIVLAPSVTAQCGDTEGGAPVTVIEAQVAGIPVVGTLHCDIPMVVINNKTGLLCAEKDTATLSSNLETLVVDVDLRNRMGVAAKAHASQQHDIKNQVEKLLKVYKGIC